MCIVLSYDWKKIGWNLSFSIHYTVEECRGIKREVSTLCAYGKTCCLAQHSTLWCTQTRKGHLDYYRVLSPFFVTWQNLIWYFFSLAMVIIFAICYGRNLAIQLPSSMCSVYLLTFVKANKRNVARDLSKWQK